MSTAVDCCPRCGSVGPFTFIYPCRYRPNQHHEWHNGMGTTAAVTHAVDPVPALTAQLAAIRAERDEAVALLKEAGPLLFAMGFDRKAPEDMLSRIDALVGRTPS